MSVLAFSPCVFPADTGSVDVLQDSLDQRACNLKTFPFEVVPLRDGAKSTIQKYAQDIISDNGELDESFYVVDLGVLRRNHSAWTNLFPGVVPHYAVKCNPDVGIVAMLASLGAKFDCASPAEIDLVLSQGVPASDIIYANPTKRPCDLRFARTRGVNVCTFDCESEIHKVAQHYPEMKMVLRIKAEDPNALCQMSNKFGALPHVWRGLLETARSRGVDVVGVSFHVGSGANTPAAFERAICDARRVVDMGEELGFKMKLVDIGGGFCCNIRADGSVDLGGIPAAVNAALAEYFPPSSGITWIAEPGRYFAEHTSTLVSQVIGRRVHHADDPVSVTGAAFDGETGSAVESREYWLTDGIYGSFNCMLYDHVEPKPQALDAPHLDRSQTFPSTFFGPTCDGLDTIVKDYPLPELDLGDWVAFSSMGAYTIAGASTFNGMDFQKARKFYVDSAKHGGERVKSQAQA